MSDWQLVPKTPTPEMLRAYATAGTWRFGLTIGQIAANEWAAMLAAAPKPPIDEIQPGLTK